MCLASAKDIKKQTGKEQGSLRAKLSTCSYDDPVLLQRSRPLLSFFKKTTQMRVFFSLLRIHVVVIRPSTHKRCLPYGHQDVHCHLRSHQPCHPEVPHSFFQKKKVPHSWRRCPGCVHQPLSRLTSSLLTYHAETAGYSSCCTKKGKHLSVLRECE